MTLEALRDADPRTVGPYALLGRLGQGGMGVVYLGRAPDGTRVAVKVIHARMAAQADFRRRFAREVAAAKRVARFCTAPVLDADVEGEVAYLVTEYVEGPSLGAAIRESGPLKGSALDGLAAAMAMALRAIHAAGVVHSDLKPSNVLLSQVGPKVIDFGVAQVLDAETTSAVVGTPAYMSPEQVSGAPLGPASDIFSWGCTVAYAASGVPPFGTGSMPTVLLRIVNDPPDLRGLPDPLRELVTAALSKDPSERPTAQELMDRLSASSHTGSVSVEHSTPHAADTGTGTRARMIAWAEGRRRRLTAAGAAVVVAAVGGSTAVAWHNAQTSATATASRTTTSSTATASGGQGSTTAATGGGHHNPLRAEGRVTFYAPAEGAAARQAGLWEKDRPEDAALMRKLAAVPHAIRLGEPEVRPKIAATLTAARQAGGVPVFLVNRLPGSDCRPRTSAAMDAYQEWIKGIAGAIGQAGAVVILEPGALVKVPGAANCDPRGSADQRYADLRQAVRTLESNPNTAVYLDGSHNYWPGTEIMAQRLIKSGVHEADGFFVNTAGYQPTDKNVEYGRALSACISVQRATGGQDCPTDAKVDPATMPHFVVDTARNGQGAWQPDKKYPDPQTWCNPPGRGVGDRPTTDTGEELADAYLWITRAGSSNGRCRRGTDGEKDPVRGIVLPEAGEWWPAQALERARNANPPL
ncbi:protein kinase [Nonomuraea phyllanthi]|uniref:glycoside hydrolase family 6 protein n=1 Tax=Nonomuraea phyllanthi TaxID=2219224 RepID=UPI001293E110|nr:glycoside hydrolase family 6 protein [Nonomuraea phyllanthi]QFY07250.1 protein kinase [Nonomuraea phyllanthi]